MKNRIDSGQAAAVVIARATKQYHYTTLFPLPPEISWTPPLLPAYVRSLNSAVPSPACWSIVFVVHPAGFLYLGCFGSHLLPGISVHLLPQAVLKTWAIYTFQTTQLSSLPTGRVWLSKQTSFSEPSFWRVPHQVDVLDCDIVTRVCFIGQRWTGTEWTFLLILCFCDFPSYGFDCLS